MFNQFLHFENIMIPICIVFFLTHVNQFSLMNFSHNGLFPKTINPSDNFSTIQDVFLLILNKLHEANELFERPIIASSLNNELGKQTTPV